MPATVLMPKLGNGLDRAKKKGTIDRGEGGGEITGKEERARCTKNKTNYLKQKKKRKKRKNGQKGGNEVEI